MDSEGQISRGHSMVMIDLLVKNPLNVFFLLKQCEGKEEKQVCSNNLWLIAVVSVLISSHLPVIVKKTNRTFSQNPEAILLSQLLF